MLWLFPLTSAGAAQDTPLPPIGWISDGAVWVYLDGDARLITQNAQDATLSPDGARLAYFTADSLTLLDPIQPDTPLFTTPINALNGADVVGYPAWDNRNGLWLTTFTLDSTANLLTPRWDAWRISEDSLTPIADAGQGGAAFPSPNSDVVALAYPGQYGGENGVIRLLSLDGQPLNQTSFPAVSSASHIAWLPSLQWVGEAVRFPLPDPDLVYSRETTPPTRLLELPLTGEARDIGTVTSAYPAAVIWSPEGESVAYLQRGETTESLWIDERLIVENLGIGSAFIGWGEALWLYSAGRLVQIQVDDSHAERVDDSRAIEGVADAVIRDGALAYLQEAGGTLQLIYDGNTLVENLGRNTWLLR